MNVTIRFTGPLRTLAGHYTLHLSLDDGATLRDLFAALRDAVPPPFVEQVLAPLEAGGPPLALLLLNRTHLRASTELDHPLTDGDVIAFVPPMAGG
ncbi:MAG: MoaD/ThiS family protein [Anaerolineae bacterium]